MGSVPPFVLIISDPLVILCDDLCQYQALHQAMYKRKGWDAVVPHPGGSHCANAALPQCSWMPCRSARQDSQIWWSDSIRSFQILSSITLCQVDNPTCGRGTFWFSQSTSAIHPFPLPVGPMSKDQGFRKERFIELPSLLGRFPGINGHEEKAKACTDFSNC